MKIQEHMQQNACQTLTIASAEQHSTQHLADRRGLTRIDADRRGSTLGGLMRIDADRRGSTRIDADRRSQFVEHVTRNCVLCDFIYYLCFGMLSMNFIVFYICLIVVLLYWVCPVGKALQHRSSHCALQCFLIHVLPYVRFLQLSRRFVEVGSLPWISLGLLVSLLALSAGASGASLGSPWVSLLRWRSEVCHVISQASALGRFISWTRVVHRCVSKILFKREFQVQVPGYFQERFPRELSKGSLGESSPRTCSREIRERVPRHSSSSEFRKRVVR